MIVPLSKRLVGLVGEATAFAEQAVALDSQSWRGYGLIGMNQLRTGAVELGRANLEVSFAGDPFNPWTKNTLDLLDTFSNYTTVRSKHFDLVLHQDEFRLLQIYVGEVADEAYETLPLVRQTPLPRRTTGCAR